MNKKYLMGEEIFGDMVHGFYVYEEGVDGEKCPIFYKKEDAEAHAAKLNNNEPFNCEECQDTGENKNGESCQECCDHEWDSSEGFMCINCGSEYPW